MTFARTGAGALLALGLLPGCGAIFHSSQTVTVTAPPDADVYMHGVRLPQEAGAPKGTYKAPVFLNAASGFTVVAPGKKTARVTPERKVDAAAIVCDVLWSLTIVGIAAPISDGILGTFQKTETDVTVKLEPDPAAQAKNPMPVYSIFGTTVAATAEAPPAPAPGAPP